MSTLQLLDAAGPAAIAGNGAYVATRRVASATNSRTRKKPSLSRRPTTYVSAAALRTRRISRNSPASASPVSRSSISARWLAPISTGSVASANSTSAATKSSESTMNSGTPNQNPAMRKKVDHGANLSERLTDRAPCAVGAAAFGVLIRVRYLVAGYTERGHAPLPPDRLGQAQRLRLSVVVVGEESGDDLDPNALEPVRVQQAARGVAARHTGMIRDRAVPPEDRPNQSLDRQAEDKRHEQEQPDYGGHGRTLTPLSRVLHGPAWIRTRDRRIMSWAGARRVGSTWLW